MTDRILLVEDDRELRAFLEEVLVAAGYRVSAHATGGKALAEIRREPDLALVVTDLVVPGLDGRELLAEVREHRPELAVIVITAFGSIDSAIELVKAGAFGYLPKPFQTDELLLVVERALAESRPRRDAVREARSAPPPPGFVGASRPMRELFAVLRRLAPSRLPVLVSGETGTGKEVVARAIHRLSERGAFVAVNCAALPEPLLESELFGHVKGAFTGADREKEGLFEAADRGTLFLDEIGEMPKTLQPKLLRALEEGEVRRVGSNRSVAVDVRVVAATNRDLERAVEIGEFREDLFWRLNVMPLAIPALRDRTADIPLLAEHFMEQFVDSPAPPPSARRIAPEAMALMTGYLWPGNVRELRNVVEGAATLAEGEAIEAGDLPARVRDSAGSGTLLRESADGALPLRELERRYVLEIVKRTGGNRSRAAELLGLDRKTLYRKLQEYGIDEAVD